MEVQHTQTVQAEMEYLLTKEAYLEWINNYFHKIDLRYPYVHISLYLKEHGLPLDSQIKGL